ncbi:phospho-N-acetylmuramoyl-pentapeptide-transferase [Prochlorococcus marinus]|uniref:phospho-N-acetylmuramoyl-pentapeptide- transferase n=1 Tax=Prochlorococcus marinus TaxID=1219 RepID=UPI0022B375EC|nr:phospho-N-acetylmuramoyl-pentapeptide-transferase [Prochlorococcus marinus]
MTKSTKVLNKKKISFLNKINQQIFILFGLITIVCVFSDFYFENSNLTVPFIITALISFIITFFSIPILKKIKIKQIIRKEGPKKHLLKEGTPTMGGVFFIPTGIIISNIIYINNENYKIILTLSLLIVFFMLIGLIDDLISLKKKLNTGLTSNEKLILQFFISLIFIIICAFNNFIPNNIQIGNQSINIGNLIYPLGIFVLLSESNSSNLTDGLDGLLSGCSALIFTGLAISISIENQSIGETLAPFCIVMSGCCMGFLFLNKYPAKLFMGDSGSLAIGASLGGIALISNNLWSLLIMGGILAAESISVIVQVSIFKISKRIKGKGHKLFLMTPIHHHFELQGNKESQIVGGFWFITLLLVIINLIFFIKP